MSTASSPCPASLYAFFSFSSLLIHLHHDKKTNGSQHNSQEDSAARGGGGNASEWCDVGVLGCRRGVGARSNTNRRPCGLNGRVDVIASGGGSSRGRGTCLQANAAGTAREIDLRHGNLGVDDGSRNAR